MDVADHAPNRRARKKKQILNETGDANSPAKDHEMTLLPHQQGGPAVSR
jgi:hypothetical protein